MRGIISDEGGFTAPINPKYLARGGRIEVKPSKTIDLTKERSSDPSYGSSSDSFNAVVPSESRRGRRRKEILMGSPIGPFGQNQFKEDKIYRGQNPATMEEIRAANEAVNGESCVILEDGGVVDPVRNWLRKHNELNERLIQTAKYEPTLMYQRGGFVNSIVEGDQPYHMANGGGLGGFVKGLASIGPLLDVVKNLGNQGFKI